MVQSRDASSAPRDRAWQALKEESRPLHGRIARVAATLVFSGLFGVVALALLWLMFN